MYGRGHPGSADTAPRQNVGRGKSNTALEASDRACSPDPDLNPWPPGRRERGLPLPASHRGAPRSQPWALLRAAPISVAFQQPASLRGPTLGRTGSSVVGRFPPQQETSAQTHQWQVDPCSRASRREAPAASRPSTRRKPELPNRSPERDMVVRDPEMQRGFRARQAQRTPAPPRPVHRHHW